MSICVTSDPIQPNQYAASLINIMHQQPPLIFYLPIPPPDGSDVSLRPLGLPVDRSIMELIPDLPRNNGQPHFVFSLLSNKMYFFLDRTTLVVNT